MSDTLMRLKAAMARAVKAALREPFNARLQAEAADARAAYRIELACKRLADCLDGVELDDAARRRIVDAVEQA